MVGVTAADGIASFGQAVKHIDVAIDDLWNGAGNVFIGDELTKAANALDTGMASLVDNAPSERALIEGLDTSRQELIDFAEASATPGYAQLFKDGPLTEGGNVDGRRNAISFLKNAVDGAQSRAREAIQLLQGR